MKHRRTICEVITTRMEEQFGDTFKILKGKPTWRLYTLPEWNLEHGDVIICVGYEASRRDHPKDSIGIKFHFTAGTDRDHYSSLFNRLKSLTVSEFDLKAWPVRQRVEIDKFTPEQVSNLTIKAVNDWRNEIDNLVKWYKETKK